MALTPLSEAMSRLFEQLPSPPATETLPLDDCLGRVLSAPVVASVDVPPFDNSAMDGFAVRVSDIPGELPISQRVPAGSAASPLATGSAARIFTGAIIPEGADAVVMQEDALQQGDKVSILGCLSPGLHIRRRGSDIAAGETVLPAGRVLQPQDLGLAASVGSATLSVYRKLKVAVITTGDELVEPGATTAAWQIYNSNGAQITAQLRQLGMTPIQFGSLPDDPVVIGDALERAAREADCIVTSGGVSVGEEDHVRNQIESRGRLELWKLAIKPGKPLAFGCVGDRPVFGLPGNPVSSWATFGLVVKPWLLRAQGALVPPMRRVVARAAFAVPKPGTREEYLRVVLAQQDGQTVAQLTGDQSSGVLSSTGFADALAIIPIGATLREGDAVDVVLLTEFLTPFAAG